MNHGDRDEILARADIEEIDWHTDQCAVCAEYPRHPSTLVVFGRLRGSPHRQHASVPSLGTLTPKNAHFGELDFGANGDREPAQARSLPPRQCAGGGNHLGRPGEISTR